MIAQLAAGIVILGIGFVLGFMLGYSNGKLDVLEGDDNES